MQTGAGLPGNCMAVDQTFRFLTIEEFNRLSRREKVAYLDQAAARIKKKRGDPTQRSLFRDRSPAPAAGEAPLPKKPA